MITSFVTSALKVALSRLRRGSATNAAPAAEIVEPDMLQPAPIGLNKLPAAAIPVGIEPQPWQLARDYKDAFPILRIPAPLPQPYISPTVYGRSSLPLADEALPNLHAPPALTASSARNIILLPKNVVLSAATSRVLNYTFLRDHNQVHGGVSRVLKTDAFQLRYSLDSLDTYQLDRPVYYADTDRPGVYGHVLLEAITRLWALRQTGVGAAVVTSVRLNKNYARLFRCLGADPDSIILIDRPFHAREVVFPDLPMRRRSWIHPQAWNVFDTLRELARLSTVDTPERVYISRSRVKGRRLLNEAAVEDLFSEKGFAIVHPQELPIEDQIKIFSNAILLASAGGSAAHNALFSLDRAKVLILSSDSWLVNADILLSQVKGRLAYVFGEPVNRPANTHRTQADWTIDINHVRSAIRSHFEIR